ncbi:MAG: hypothetical protein ACRELT_09945 [Longimicrobiales bacterium]
MGFIIAIELVDHASGGIDEHERIGSRAPSETLQNVSAPNSISGASVGPPRSSVAW